jgi:ferrochelatase
VIAYEGEPQFRHGEASRIGVLVCNLGTPTAPTTAALRAYLRHFLGDPRVIELPRWQWLPILHLFVLTMRPAKSAALYRKVWTPEGSPLLLGTRKVAAKLRNALTPRVSSGVEVEVAMRYGEPSTHAALRALAARGCRRVLVLPLYPQYSGTTTASTFDDVFASLQRTRWVPELRTVASYHDDPAYVGALAASIREHWAAHGRGARLQLSFHGIPKRYFESGDPYYCECQTTARLLAAALEVPREEILVTFQSLFGKEEWLRPYTDETVKRLGAEKLASLDILCPGFAVDCLETLEEIDGLNREFFQHAGGGAYRYVACLNDRTDHVEALAGIVMRHLAGWVSPTATDDAARDAAAQAIRERALAAAATYPSAITAR